MKKGTKNTKKSPSMENAQWAKAVGKSTLLRIDWKDWKKELPKNCADIIVVLKTSPVRGKQFSVVHATYFDEKFKKTKDWPATRFQRISFREYDLGEIFIGSKEEKHLVAWGTLKKVIALAKDCPICKRLDCIC